MRTMKLKHIILSVLACGSFIGAQAQKAWVVPEMFNPDDSVTLYVNIAACDCQRLLNSQDDLFMWAWNPADPVIGNGNWTASNPDMVMTRSADDPNIYYKRVQPSTFYAIGSPADIYKNGFSFLVKASDGTGEGGGGCDEDKTEDLNVDAQAIPGCNTKFCQFPSTVFQDDFYQFIYNHLLEPKESMQEVNVGEGNYYVLPRAYFTDGTNHRYASYSTAKDFPELQLQKDPEDGLYRIVYIPEDFFGDFIPTGESIERMEFEVINGNYSGPNDVSDGKHVTFIGCN